MALPGTQLANQVLKDTKLTRKCARKFTYVRAKDRSYKIWGYFNISESTRIRNALEKAGALNARLTYSCYSGYTIPTGVRFEMPQSA